MQILEDRVSQSKHMMLLMGVRPWELWATQLFGDMILWALVSVPAVIVFSFVIPGYMQGLGVGLSILALMLAFGLALYSFAYCITFMSTDGKEVRKTLEQLTTMPFYLTYGAWVFTNIPGDGIPDALRIIVRYIVLLFPPTAFAIGIVELAQDRAKAFLAEQLGTSASLVTGALSWNGGGEPLFFLLLDFMIFFSLVLYVERSTTRPGPACCHDQTCGCCCCWHPACKEKGFCVSGGEPKAREAFRRQRKLNAEDLEDSTVKAERSRVQATDPVASSSPSSGALGVGEAARFDALHKRFPARGQEIVGTVAVKDMSLGVARGECLALLGTNGAGKSTSLAVFLRQYHPSTGGAYIGGLNVNSASSDQLFGEVGYCPQGNAIFEFLSGREVLRFYAAARGLPSSMLDGPDGYIQFWLSRIGLEEHADRKCGKYSGGNKRKLCMAIAFMGDPSLVVLDEPSAGVDPAARKKMWATISESRRPAGGDAAAKGGTGETTVLLTTQFMDEADALGTRIGIMVAGQLSCLGTSQALKTRFGSGYDLEIKMKDGSSIADVLPIVQSLVPAATISEQAGEAFVKLALGPVNPQLAMKDTAGMNPRLMEKEASSGNAAQGFSLADLLDAMEAAKTSQGVGNYSLSQATLDTVFLRFAKLAEELQREVEDGESGTTPGPDSVVVSISTTPEINNSMAVGHA